MADRQITFREAVVEAIGEEMRRDPKVFLMGEDIGLLGGIFGTSVGLIHEFGKDRIIDTPISEAAIVGLGVGAAMAGMRPIVDIMRIDWITICMEEIVNQAAKMRFMSGGAVHVPIVIKTNGGPGRGLGAQHSQSFESWFAHVPGLKVVMPSTPYDCKGLLKAAVRDDDPVIFIEPLGCIGVSGIVPQEEYLVPIGKADVKRVGKDATIVAWGTMLHRSLNAAKTLQDEGISVEVIDLHTLSPLDTETIINSVKKTGRLIVAHEDIKTCGVGAEIAALIQEAIFDHLDAPIKRVGAPFAIYPANRNLERMLTPDVQQIVAAAKSIL